MIFKRPITTNNFKYEDFSVYFDVEDETKRAELILSITSNEYDKKVQELKTGDQDILEQLKDHSKGDEAFSITSSYILELAHRAYELFKSSQTSKKTRTRKFCICELGRRW
ncbi:MAG: hypothetical protein PHO80_05310 [Candidatus Gracilibacteria bacterium]|nr:hypothetical protein [Candidatus Gracilibacteria bacterium]MDD4530935.1 hypothetical protein [Candidatus Gracilibacteria bacterium]